MFIKIDSENAFLTAMNKKPKKPHTHKKKNFCISDLTPLYCDLKSFHHAKIQTHFTATADA